MGTGCLTSAAIIKLSLWLKDVEELLDAHQSLTGGNRGRPAQKQGAAVTKSGVVMLTAVFEAFVEDVFERAAKDVFADELDTTRKLKDFIRETSGRLNNASVKNIDFLYAQIGYPFILRELSWKGFNNTNLRESIDAMVSVRNKIAHGGAPKVNLQNLRRWKNMIEAFSLRFENLVFEHAQEWTELELDWQVEAETE